MASGARYVNGWTDVNANVTQPKEINIQNTGNEPLMTDAGIGAVPAAAMTAGVTAEEYGEGVFHKTLFTFTAVDVTMTDHGTSGCSGSLKIYDFPAGNLSYFGGTTNLTLAVDGTNITAVAAVVASFGTTAAGADNATLTSTEADFIPLTACTLVAGAGSFLGKSVTATAAVFDGTATAKDLYINFAVPDADSAGNDALIVDGTATIVWANLGDN